MTDRNNTDRSDSKKREKMLDFQTLSASPLYFLISLMAVMVAVLHGCDSSPTPTSDPGVPQETQADDSNSTPTASFGPDDLDVSPSPMETTSP